MATKTKLIEATQNSEKKVDELVNEFIAENKDLKVKGINYQTAVHNDIHHFAFISYEEKDENENRKVGF